MKSKVFKKLRSLPMGEAMVVANKEYSHIHPSIVVAAADLAKDHTQFTDILSGNHPLCKEVEDLAWVYLARYCQASKTPMPKTIQWGEKKIHEPPYKMKAIIDDGDTPVSLSCYSSTPVVVLANMMAAIKSNPELLRTCIKNQQP